MLVTPSAFVQKNHGKWLRFVAILFTFTAMPMGLAWAFQVKLENRSGKDLGISCKTVGNQDSPILAWLDKWDQQQDKRYVICDQTDSLIWHYQSNYNLHVKNFDTDGDFAEWVTFKFLNPDRSLYCVMRLDYIRGLGSDWFETANIQGKRCIKDYLNGHSFDTHHGTATVHIY